MGSADKGQCISRLQVGEALCDAGGTHVSSGATDTRCDLSARFSVARNARARRVASSEPRFLRASAHLCPSFSLVAARLFRFVSPTRLALASRYTVRNA